jgi:hypothetical protein
MRRMAMRPWSLRKARRLRTVPTASPSSRPRGRLPKGRRRLPRVPPRRLRPLPLRRDPRRPPLLRRHDLRHRLRLRRRVPRRQPWLRRPDPRPQRLHRHRHVRHHPPLRKPPLHRGPRLLRLLRHRQQRRVQHQRHARKRALPNASRKALRVAGSRPPVHLLALRRPHSGLAPLRRRRRLPHRMPRPPPPLQSRLRRPVRRGRAGSVRKDHVRMDCVREAPAHHPALRHRVLRRPTLRHRPPPVVRTRHRLRHWHVARRRP